MTERYQDLMRDETDRLATEDTFRNGYDIVTMKGAGKYMDKLRKQFETAEDQMQQG